MTPGSPKRFLAATALAATLAVTAVPALAAPATGTAAATITVSGKVAHPGGVTAADLAALGETAYPVTNPAPGAPKSVTGASLNDLVTKVSPTLPEGKHTDLRVILTVSGKHGRTTFALGELEPKFGNHPAVLVPHTGGIDLVVPGDRNRTRSVRDVGTVSVAISDAGVADVPNGSVTVGKVTLPGWLLSHLPAETVTVNFQTDKGPQTHTERGTPLWLVLLLAGQFPASNTAVTAVGDDGYGTAVTLGEDYVGGRPLLLSTVEDGTPLMRPRLIPYGDLAGGRYNSYLVRLAVS